MNSVYVSVLLMFCLWVFSTGTLLANLQTKHNVVTQRTKEGDDEMVGDNKQTSLNTNGRK